MTRKGNDDVDKSLENFVKPMQVNLFLASFSLMELLCAITAADFLPFASLGAVTWPCVGQNNVKFVKLQAFQG